MVVGWQAQRVKRRGRGADASRRYVTRPRDTAAAAAGKQQCALTEYGTRLRDRRHPASGEPERTLRPHPVLHTGC